MHTSIAETALILKWIEQGEGEINLGVVSITMDEREMLRNNVEEAGDSESE